jgi:hypothetical protein
MKKLLLILLFSSSLSAASLLHYKYPFYYFMVGDELLACHQTKAGTDCFANDIKTHIKVIYKCKRVTKEQGYIKDCKTKPTI